MRARDSCRESGERLARKRNAINFARFHGRDRGFNSWHSKKNGFRGGTLRGAEGRGIGDTADAYPRIVGVLDFRKVGAGRYKVGALQQVIGTAEVDELLALLVDRHESNEIGRASLGKECR